jgi:hypothetical protein
MLRTRLFPLNGAAKIAAGIVRRSAQRVNPSRAVHEFGNVEKISGIFPRRFFFAGNFLQEFFARQFFAKISGANQKGSLRFFATVTNCGPAESPL